MSLESISLAVFPIVILNISHSQSMKILVPPLVRNTGTSSVEGGADRLIMAAEGCPADTLVG
jgi:hypothetical protein